MALGLKSQSFLATWFQLIEGREVVLAMWAWGSCDVPPFASVTHGFYNKREEQRGALGSDFWVSVQGASKPPSSRTLISTTAGE